MIITTTESVAGYVISEYLGAAYGAESYTVKGNLNGELTDLDQAYSKAFEVAKAQMSAKAELLGADAVIGIKSTMTTVGATNIVIVAVNGTAVKAVKEEAKAEQSGVLSVQVVEPVTVANPVTEVAITNPVTEVTVTNPVTEVAVTNPVTEVTVANPVKEVTVANPVKDVNVVNAVKLADSIKIDVPVAAVAATAAPVVEEEPTVVNLEDILEKPAPQAVVPEPVVEEPVAVEPVVEEAVAAEPVVAEPVVEETEPESKEEEAPSLFSDALAGAGKIFIPDPVVEVSSAAPIPPKKEEEKQEEEPAPAVPEKSSIPGVQPVVPPVKKVVEEEKTSEMPLEDKLLLILKENGRKMDMMDIVNELESKVGAFEIIELLEKAVALGKCKKDGKQYYVD